jgi:hypothetical protein
MNEFLVLVFEQIGIFFFLKQFQLCFLMGVGLKYEPPYEKAFGLVLHVSGWQYFNIW